MAGKSFEEMQKALRAMHASVRRELHDMKNRVRSRMVKEHMSGPTGPSSVRARSGQLRRALDGTIATWGNENKMQLVMFFGGGVPYARVHEYGGTILPKRAKNLAIPVGAALTRAGVSKTAGPQAIWAMLKFIKSKKTGKKLLVNRFSKGKLDVWFVLVPSITLPPRLNFGNTFQQEAEATMRNLRAIRIKGKT